MKKQLILLCGFCGLTVACSAPHLPLVAATALDGSMSLLVPPQWLHHQRIHGWASDCKGCSYSENGDYFGEDSLQMNPITPPKKSFCTGASKIIPGSFQRSFPFKPDIKTELKVIKQKDPFAYNEKIAVSLVDRAIDVSYESLGLDKQSALYCRSIIYAGPNRRVRISFKGKDTPDFRETLDAVCKSIRIKSAFLNEQIDE